jgi:hypothetical protein
MLKGLVAGSQRQRLLLQLRGPFAAPHSLIAAAELGFEVSQHVQEQGVIRQEQTGGTLA